MRPILVCALLLAAVASAGCHTRKSIALDQVNALKPEQAWVTETDQSVILVTTPQVVGDTLVGYVNGVYEEMPAARLKDVVVSRPATTRTVLLVSAIAIGFGGFAYAVAGAVGGNKYIGADFSDETPEDPACADL